MNRIVAFLITLLLASGSVQLFAQASGSEKKGDSDPALSRSYLYLAGYYRADLKLSDRQMDSIRLYTKKASKMAKRATAGEVNSFERKVLKGILSEGQLEDLYVNKNIPEARLLAQKIWNEMISLGYVGRSDSVRLYQQVRSHLHTLLVARDYYAENPELQKKYLEELSERAPACLYRYYHNGERRPAANNYYRADFLY
jgi:hypothetical protein